MNGGEEKREWVTGGKVRGKETTRKPKRRWEDNIQKELREIRWDVWEHPT
jgi:hypothetical protein